jgi:uncharacterized membrane protein
LGLAFSAMANLIVDAVPYPPDREVSCAVGFSMLLGAVVLAVLAGTTAGDDPE